MSDAVYIYIYILSARVNEECQRSREGEIQGVRLYNTRPCWRAHCPRIYIYILACCIAAAHIYMYTSYFSFVLFLSFFPLFFFMFDRAREWAKHRRHLSGLYENIGIAYERQILSLRVYLYTHTHYMRWWWSFRKSHLMRGACAHDEWISKDSIYIYISSSAGVAVTDAHTRLLRANTSRRKGATIYTGVYTHSF